MAFFGADADMIAALTAQAEQDDGANTVEIHSDNGPAFSLFCALGSQWRFCAAGDSLRHTGIDYGAVEMAGRLMRIDLDTEVFARLRVLESAALEAWADERRNAR